MKKLVIAAVFGLEPGNVRHMLVLKELGMLQ